MISHRVKSSYVDADGAYLNTLVRKRRVSHVSCLEFHMFWSNDTWKFPPGIEIAIQVSIVHFIGTKHGKEENKSRKQILEYLGNEGLFLGGD